MARTKYTSINFNDVYEKKVPSSNPSKTSSSSSPSSPFSSSRNASNTALYKTYLTQGRMLVLSRPTPKSTSVPSPKESKLHLSLSPDQTRSEPEADPISLRPLSRTGGGLHISSPVPIQERNKEVLIPVTSPKPDRFVPPHLRPGFAGKEERPGFEVQKQRQLGSYGSPGRYGENGRPKSGGHDRMRRGGEANLGRATSFGNRPSSSGW